MNKLIYYMQWELALLMEKNSEQHEGTEMNELDGRWTEFVREERMKKRQMRGEMVIRERISGWRRFFKSSDKELAEEEL